MNEPSIRRSARRFRNAKLQVECLEARSLLACSVLAAGAQLNITVLSIDGTRGGDVIDIQNQDNALVGDPSDDTISVVVNAIEVANCPVADVTEFVIRAGNGHDTVTIGDGVTIGAEVHGGNGNDTIEGGDGDDTLIGENGKDTIDGDDGNDLVLGGNGHDILQGGLGSDTLEGGTVGDILNDPDGDANLNGDLGRDTINGVLEPIGI
jgi:Ca2+-binding RTX toxin-like protein